MRALNHDLSRKRHLRLAKKGGLAERALAGFKEKPQRSVVFRRRHLTSLWVGRGDARQRKRKGKVKMGDLVRDRKYVSDIFAQLVTGRCWGQTKLFAPRGVEKGGKKKFHYQIRKRKKLRSPKEESRKDQYHRLLGTRRDIAKTRNLFQRRACKVSWPKGDQETG